MLGALTLTTLGAGLCFLINALSYLAVLAALRLMDRSRLNPQAEVARGLPEGRRSLAHEIAAPLRSSQ